MTDEQVTLEPSDSSPGWTTRRKQGALAGAALALVAGVLLFLAAKNTGRSTTPTKAGVAPTTTVSRFPGQIGGEFSLNDDKPSYEALGDPCRGRGGYSDINENTQVTVSDATDRIVAVGHLGSGRWSGATYDPRCVFNFLIEDVPKLDLYQIEVGRRGKVAYPYDKLALVGFTVDVSLGN